MGERFVSHFHILILYFGARFTGVKNCTFAEFNSINVNSNEQHNEFHDFNIHVLFMEFGQCPLDIFESQHLPVSNKLDTNVACNICPLSTTN